MAGEIRILVIEDDEASQKAIRQMLDAEGWEVVVVPSANQGILGLAAGGWALVVVSVGLCGLQGLLFETLKELVTTEPSEGSKARVRALFVVPATAGRDVQAALERDGLPYVVKPLHLHDFLERVSDLLMETSALEAPIRQVRGPLRAQTRTQARGAGWGASKGRQTSMFSSRDEYSYSEEDLAEYERLEKEAAQAKKKKKRDLGLP